DRRQPKLRVVRRGWRKSLGKCRSGLVQWSGRHFDGRYAQYRRGKCQNSHGRQHLDSALVEGQPVSRADAPRGDDQPPGPEPPTPDTADSAVKDSPVTRSEALEGELAMLEAMPPPKDAASPAKPG